MKIRYLNNIINTDLIQKYCSHKYENGESSIYKEIRFDMSEDAYWKFVSPMVVERCLLCGKLFYIKKPEVSVS